ncbi:MAG: MerR family transcriptional regulator [Trueperaceae bacterium]|nr:MAG: MerR family transcriptional regulator [Trueperaceae bacterium]
MPATFDSLTSRDADWNLDDFVDEVNAVLPDVVPDAAAKGKLAVNARLVRHYTTEGVLPRPLKDGVEARYDTDHLVRVLTLRRLLAEGYPSTVAGAFLHAHDRETLARFLLGELRLGLDLAPGGPTATPMRFTHLRPSARSQLDAMRRRAGLAPLEERHEERGAPRGDDQPAMSAPPAHALHRRAPADLFDDVDDVDHDVFESRAEPLQPQRQQSATVFTRYDLLDGLELHVRHDFEDPTTPAAWNTLRDAILARLEQIALERVTKR